MFLGGLLDVPSDTIPKTHSLLHLPEGLKKDDFLIWLGGGHSNIFWNFHPEDWGFMESKLTSIFFKWVGEKPPTRFLLQCGHYLKEEDGRDHPDRSARIWSEN